MICDMPRAMRACNDLYMSEHPELFVAPWGAPKPSYMVDPAPDHDPDPVAERIDMITEHTSIQSSWSQECSKTVPYIPYAHKKVVHTPSGLLGREHFQRDELYLNYLRDYHIYTKYPGRLAQTTGPDGIPRSEWIPGP